MKRSQILTRLGVYWVVLCVVIWSLPSGPKNPKNFVTKTLQFNSTKIKPLIQNFMYPSGLWQMWNMFSHDPNVTQNDWYNRERFIVFNYKEKKSLRIPVYQPRLMSETQKILNVRYQKYFDSASNNSNAYLIERFAETIRDQEIEKGALRPDSIQLVEVWKKIAGFRLPSITYPETILYDSEIKTEK
jgi:hypothetical protein